MLAEILEHGPGLGLRRLQQLAEGSLLISSRELECLASTQHRATRNYYRLLDAQRELQQRARGAPRSFGTVLADALDVAHQRLGRELHTGVGQSLAGIQLHTGLLEAALPDPPEPVRRSLDRIKDLANTALEQVRGVSRRLYVPAWQALPLNDALRSLWESSGVSEKFAGSLELRALSAEPAPEVRRALYLAAQEGISNAILHAAAQQVRLSLFEGGGRVVLEVIDDGAGFRAPAESDGAPSSGGIGLRSLRDLARDLGGELVVRGTSQGTHFRISLPVSHE